VLQTADKASDKTEMISANSFENKIIRQKTRQKRTKKRAKNTRRKARTETRPLWHRVDRLPVPSRRAFFQPPADWMVSSRLLGPRSRRSWLCAPWALGERGLPPTGKWAAAEWCGEHIDFTKKIRPGGGRCRSICDAQ
jgi:hypothetical protein